MLLRPMTPGESVTLAPTGSNARIAIPKGAFTDQTLRYATPSGNTAKVYIAFGSDAVVAAVATTSFAADCYPIYPGTDGRLTIPALATHIAYISATGTQELSLTLAPGGV